VIQTAGIVSRSIEADEVVLVAPPMVLGWMRPQARLLRQLGLGVSLVPMALEHLNAGQGRNCEELALKRDVQFFTLAPDFDQVAA